jgi:hypothetical protein
MHVPRGRGREHERRILTTLALYDPANLGASAGADTDPPRRQLIVDLD